MSEMQGIKADILAWVAKAQQAQKERDAAWQKQGYTPPHMADQAFLAPTPSRYAQPDDDTRADVTWLMYSLGSVAALRGLNFTWAAKQGFTRGHWRQGLATLLEQQPAEVQDPCAVVIAAARAAAKRLMDDPRLAPGYVPLVTWGGAALRIIGLVA